MTVSRSTTVPVTFATVEAARRAYQQKAAKRSKTFVVTFCCSLAVFIAIGLPIVLPNLVTATGVPILAYVALVLFIAIGPALILSFIIAYLTSSTTVEQQAYRRAYKGYFVAQQLAAVFTNLTYDHASGIDRAAITRTNLIHLKSDSRYRSNDLVTARYKDVSFTQADVTIEEPSEPDEDGHRTYHQVFKGRYLFFAFPKKFHSQMVVSRTGLGEGHRNPATGRFLERIETESTTFNHHFLVYAEDGHDAFYILNPVFIENLEKLAIKYADRVVAYFTDNQMIISINDNNDAFEPPANAKLPLDEKKELSRVLEDIHCITEIVDSLRLSR